LKLFVLREFIFWNNILENRDGWIKSRDTIYYPDKYALVIRNILKRIKNSYLKNR